MFTKSTDEFVIKTVRDNFAFVTGQTRPVPKGKSKNDDDVTPEQWFGAMSPLHFMFFFHAFPVAVERGLLHSVEVAMGQEIIDMINEHFDGRAPK